MAITYPKISIVTPSYNQGKFIEETILSVLNQNYPNLEYIIIDGGSTDETIDIINKYASKLSYWVSEPDGGMYYAIQKGFEKSSGDIMAWINSDDKYHPGAFDIIRQVFEQFPMVEWLTGIPTVWNESGLCVAVNPLYNWSKYEMYSGEYYQQQRWIQQESTFWRRSLWEKAGGYMNTELQLAGDFELWLRFFQYTKLYPLQALIAGFRIQAEQQTAIKYDSYLKEAYECLQHKITHLDDQTIRTMKQIKSYNRWLEWTSRVNVYRWQEQRLRLLDYPPRVCYNFKKKLFDIAPIV
ncbi:glycosyltransferase family 2 protein [Eisenibacter elegans]|jgi:glycosyltransferase involved in cell wall biosynthesis|uniref:glycosyltransferase family 2 protein n=1 Tax=Eisenibacter elegans TaxID=997 RepID=UPI000686A749|nr:glycosyltransferase family 2 protein [Eisenibacter elegans]